MAPPLRQGIDFAWLARNTVPKPVKPNPVNLIPVPPSQTMAIANPITADRTTYQQGVSNDAYRKALTDVQSSGDPTIDSLVRNRLMGNQGAYQQYFHETDPLGQQRVNAVAQSSAGTLAQRQGDYAYEDAYRKALIDQQNARIALAKRQALAGGGGGGGRRRSGGGGGGGRKSAAGTTYITPPAAPPVDPFLAALNALLSPTALPAAHPQPAPARPAPSAYAPTSYPASHYRDRWSNRS